MLGVGRGCGQGDAEGEQEGGVGQGRGLQNYGCYWSVGFGL